MQYGHAALILLHLWNLATSTDLDTPIIHQIPNPYGVVIIPHGDAAPIASTWHAAFPLNLSQFDNQLSLLLKAAEQDKSLSPHLHSHLPSTYGLRRLINSTLARASNSLTAIRSRLYPTRSRRSPPGFGTVASALFGVASDADVARVQYELNALRDRQSSLVTLQHAQLTAFRRLSNQLTATEHRIATHINATDMLFKAVLQLYKRENSTERQQTSMHLIWQERLLHTTQLFIDALNTFRNIVDRLQAGYLSPELLPPTTLRQLLRNISASVAPAFRLPDATGSLASYYSIPMAFLLPTSNHPTAIFRIPLIHPPPYLRRFTVIPTPTTSKMSKLPFILDTPLHSFFGDADRKYALTFSAPTPPPTCHFEGPPVCDIASRPQESVDRHCVTTLYAQQTPTTPSKCPLRQALGPFPGIFPLTHRTWLIAAIQNLTISVACPTSQLAHTVNGTLLLYLPAPCAATMDSLTIPPFPTHTQTFPVPTFPLDLAAIKPPRTPVIPHLSPITDLLTHIAAQLAVLNHSTAQNLTPLLNQMAELTSSLDVPPPLHDDYLDSPMSYGADAALSAFLIVSLVISGCILCRCRRRVVAAPATLTIVPPPSQFPMLRCPSPTYPNLTTNDATTMPDWTRDEPTTPNALYYNE